jgi:hypothetical protein
MRKIDLDKWSEPDFLAKKYHQTLKCTMAFIEKNKENMSQAELLDNIIIVEHLVARICQLKDIQDEREEIYT